MEEFYETETNPAGKERTTDQIYKEIRELIEGK